MAMMDEMFDMADDVRDFDDDSVLDFEPGLEPQIRNRANTWPTRPLFDRPELSPGVGADSPSGPLLDNGADRGNRIDVPSSPGGPNASRKVSSRRNAWGNLSYADLITKAIESSPEKRLTLSQIYAWMVTNVPFFHDKGDSNSSAGWKNSIRHNLSLHSRFVRVQNEGTGKSSWWMVNPDASSKIPRKRAGTMDATSGYRRPTKPSKRLPGVLKHARSTDLQAQIVGAALGEELPETPASVTPGLADTHGFASPRVRASSGASSNSGCSPAPLSATFDPDIGTGFPVAASWDIYPKHETVSETLADMFISDAGHNCNSTAVPNSQTQQAAPSVYAQLQPQQSLFMANEAYAHGVPVHQPGAAIGQQFVTQPVGQPSDSMFGNFTVPSSSSSHTMTNSFGHGMDSTTAHVPTLGELLQDQQPGAGYLLNSLLTSGGSVTTQPTRWPSETAACAEVPASSATGSTPLRRPLHINQKVLMQLLLSKPHLATRLQQLIEAKRQQLSAMQQGHSPVAPDAAGRGISSGSMLQQLLTGSASGSQTLSGCTSLPFSDISDEAFPRDLDLNLLDIESTSDINCDIDQVIQHELSFGDKLDFSFDQLHLDEFADFSN